MKITKNGFYKLSDIKEERINIEEGITAAIFDDINRSVEIHIGENSRLDFYSYLEKSCDIKAEFYQDNTNSYLKVRSLIFSDNGLDIKYKAYSKLSSDNSKSDVSILSIVGNEGKVDLDGIIEIDKDITKVDGHLLEENLFLGDKGSVKGVPTLLVRSDDVKASHACKMERISDEKLFYLRSRGIGRENALTMMIEAKVVSLFSCLSMIDADFYEKLIEEILKKIK